MKILRLGTGIRKLMNTIDVLYNDNSLPYLSNEFVGQNVIPSNLTHIASIQILFAYLYTQILGPLFSDPGFFEV